MNIYKFELKMLRNSILIWASAITFGLVIYLMFYPLIMVENDAMDVLLESFPEEFLAFFGMNHELSFTNINGYYGLTMSFVFIPIAIQACVYGFSILSVEEREFTADFLLTKPVSRFQIFRSKLLAVFTALLFTNLTIWISSYLALFLFNSGVEVDYYGVTILLSAIGILQLVFLSVGILISVSVKKVTSVIGYAMGLGFGMFILSSFGEMLTIDFLKMISPFSHFEPISIIVNHTYEWNYASISIIVIVISLSLSYYLYQRRNIKGL